MGIWDWIVTTLRAYPELALFLALARRVTGSDRRSVAGFSLGSVTATLLVAVAIGQLGIEIPGPIKSTFFLLFLFAVGYGVGPQFFAGLAKDGPKQIVFSLIILSLCLLVPYICAKAAGLDVGYAVGLYAGSQTISASIGVATDQIEPPAGSRRIRRRRGLSAIPVGYAVTYIYGTIGSAIVLAQIGPKLIGVDLPPPRAPNTRSSMGGGQPTYDPGSAVRVPAHRAALISRRCRRAAS